LSILLGDILLLERISQLLFEVLNSVLVLKQLT
jgi:hypothetical protein